MVLLRKMFCGLLAFGIFGIYLVAAAQAHLMPAQRGTLNIQDGAVYMVLSLPVSAFSRLGIEEARDGELTSVELEKYSPRILESVRQNVTLKTDDDEIPLVGVMVSPDVHQAEQGQSIARLIILGRFNLEDETEAMYFSVTLFGSDADEELLHISARRQRDGLAENFELTPNEETAYINFPRYNL